MRILIATAALVILPLMVKSSFAGGLLDRLPADGTWARFEYVNSVGQNSTRKGSLWMASVGQTTVKGEACRWIEIRMDEKTLKFPINKTYKVLVPERHLGRGKCPLKHIIRAWSKSGDRDAKVLDPENIAGPLEIWLVSPLKDVEQLEEEVISSELGELACPGIKESGKLLDKEVEITTRLHPKAPFGVVTYEFRQKTDAGFVSAMKLTDFGDGAKSRVPEQVADSDAGNPVVPPAKTQTVPRPTSKK